MSGLPGGALRPVFGGAFSHGSYRGHSLVAYTLLRSMVDTETNMLIVLRLTCKTTSPS